VSISAFHVLAEARRTPDGKLKTRHDLSAGVVTVAGQSFGLSNGSFTVPGSGVPVPADVVFSLMKGAGITGEFQQATESKTGVVAPSLSLTYSVPATPNTRAIDVTVTLGRASADVRSVAYGEDGTPVSGVQPAPVDSGDSSAGSGTSGAAAASQQFLPQAPGNSASPVDATGQSPVLAPSSTAAQPTFAAVSQPVLHDLRNIYLAVVAAALFTFGTATGVRLVGVRFT
jgi:hypothetical protein